MRFSDLLKLSTRMFKARTSRTLLTILGMSIGIGAILFLVSLGYGLQKTLLEKITTSDSLLTLDIAESTSGIVSLNRDSIGKMEEMDGVVEVSPAFQLAAQGNMDELSADLVVIGTDPSFLRMGGIKVTEGKTLDNEDQRGIIITSALVGILDKNSSDLQGKEMSFDFYIEREAKQEEEVSAGELTETGELPAEETTEEDNEISSESENGLKSNFERVSLDDKYKVVGIIESDISMVYINSKTLENLNIDKYSQVKVRCENNIKMNLIRDNILEQGLIVSSLSDTVDQANQIFKLVQIVLMLFGVVALAVSAIGMFNTMTIALLERTEEIGIMKSIGASDVAISFMFVMESTIMGFLGGIVGILIGFGGGEVFNIGVNMIAGRFGGESVDLFHSPLWFVGLIALFAGIVGFFTGVVPARRASKIDPLDALRYK